MAAQGHVPADMGPELGHGADGRLGGHAALDDGMDEPLLDIRFIRVVDLFSSQHPLDFG